MLKEYARRIFGADIKEDIKKRKDLNGKRATRTRA
jgi:hypothetical protein